MKVRDISPAEQERLNEELLNLCGRRDVDLSIIKDLISNGADIHYRTSFKYTPLHLACMYGSVDLVRFLLENGALEDIHALNANKERPLHDACFFRNVNVVKFLLENGALEDIHAVDSFGCTPLHFACKYSDLHIVELLLKNGALKSINTLNDDEYTPFYLACKSGRVDIVELLLANGATIYSKYGKGNLSILGRINNFSQNIQNILLQHDAKIREVLGIILSIESMDNLEESECLKIADFYEKHIDDLKFLFTARNLDQNIDEVFKIADLYFNNIKAGVLEEYAFWPKEGTEIRTEKFGPIKVKEAFDVSKITDSLATMLPACDVDSILAADITISDLIGVVVEVEATNGDF